MADTIGVLLVDDHAVVRRGLANILQVEPGFKVLGEARDGLEAIDKALELTPDVILMDVYMPRCSGLDALAAIEERLPAANVLMLTVSESEEDLFRALTLGARGYLLKSASVEEILQAVRATATGEAILSPAVATRLVAEFREKSDGAALSAREKEVLQLLGEGLTNTEIADRLCISENTVRTYFRRILEKLHLINRGQVIAYAAHRPLISKVSQLRGK